MVQRMAPTEPACGGSVNQSDSGHVLQPPLTSKQFSTRSCTRCAGLLVSEWHYDLRDTGEHCIESLRCVQCGYRVDPVILQNQIRSPGRSQPERQARPRYSTRAGMLTILG
jgi:hypothetical protein